MMTGADLSRGFSQVLQDNDKCEGLSVLKAESEWVNNG